MTSSPVIFNAAPSVGPSRRWRMAAERRFAERATRTQRKLTRLFFRAIIASACVALLCGSPAVCDETSDEDPATSDAQSQARMLAAAAKASGYMRFDKMEAVPTEFLTDKERMKDVMRELFRKDYPGDKFQAMNALMVKFGYSMFEDKTEDEIVEDYTKGILGLYDDEKKKIYIVSSGLYEQLRDERYDECNIKKIYRNEVIRDWYRKNMEEIVLTHEAAHALEDENFDLYDRRKKFEHNDDAQLALSAISEGSAEIIETKRSMDLLGLRGWADSMDEYRWDLEMFSKLDKRVEEASKLSDYDCSKEITFLWWLSTVPYSYGSLFLERVEFEHKKEAVAQAYEKCPLSSEQVMNSKKYFDKKNEDLPTFIDLPTFDDVIDIENMRYLDYNSMGQLKLYLLCRDLYFDPITDCRPMAEGWDGDRYIVWRNTDDDILLGWYTTWDSDSDAKEFYDFYMDAWGRKSLGDAKTKTGDGWRMALAGEESMYIEKKGNDVIIIEGPLDETAFKTFTERLWTARKYEADYSICQQTRNEFIDKYPGRGGDQEKTDSIEPEENEAAEK